MISLIKVADESNQNEGVLKDSQRSAIKRWNTNLK
jgi:hypothetical protein